MRLHAKGGKVISPMVLLPGNPDTVHTFLHQSEPNAVSTQHTV